MTRKLKVTNDERTTRITGNHLSSEGNCVILGARWGKDDRDFEDMSERWLYPRPMYYVKHFRNAATKRDYLAGKIGDTLAFVSVPVFRGESYREANRRRSYAKQRRNNPSKLEEIEESMLDV